MIFFLNGEPDTRRSVLLETKVSSQLEYYNKLIIKIKKQLNKNINDKTM